MTSLAPDLSSDGAGTAARCSGAGDNSIRTTLGLRLWFHGSSGPRFFHLSCRHAEADRFHGRSSAVSCFSMYRFPQLCSSDLRTAHTDAIRLTRSRWAADLRLSASRPVIRLISRWRQIHTHYAAACTVDFTIPIETTKPRRRWTSRRRGRRRRCRPSRSHRWRQQEQQSQWSPQRGRG